LSSTNSTEICGVNTGALQGLAVRSCSTSYTPHVIVKPHNIIYNGNRVLQPKWKQITRIKNEPVQYKWGVTCTTNRTTKSQHRNKNMKTCNLTTWTTSKKNVKTCNLTTWTTTKKTGASPLGKFRLYNRSMREAVPDLDKERP
jgi:hypothetical protein